MSIGAIKRQIQKFNVPMWKIPGFLIFLTPGGITGTDPQDG
jgi:hypothetical protein